MEFRRAGAEAHPAVLALHADYGWPADDEVPDDLWIATEAGEVIGAVETVPAGEGNTVLHVAIVRASHRGHGVGSGLVGHVLSELETVWWTECREERIAFYRRLGFETVERSSLPALVVPLLDHPSTTDPTRELNFMRRAE